MINWVKSSEFIRFGIVGLFATGLHYGIYYLLISILNVNIAYTIGYVLSLSFNFILTTYFTFLVKPTMKKGVGFIFSHVINYGCHIGFLNFFLILNISKVIAPFFVFSICIPLNFVLVRYFLKDKK